jgi:hypothetical protein
MLNVCADTITPAQGSDVVPKGSGAPPSRIKTSCALVVSGFVRPFRVPAAHDLFKQHGELTLRQRGGVLGQTLQHRTTSLWSIAEVCLTA